MHGRPGIKLEKPVAKPPPSKPPASKALAAKPPVQPLKQHQVAKQHQGMPAPVAAPSSSTGVLAGARASPGAASAPVGVGNYSNISPNGGVVVSKGGEGKGGGSKDRFKLHGMVLATSPPAQTSSPIAAAVEKVGSKRAAPAKKGASAQVPAAAEGNAKKKQRTGKAAAITAFAPPTGPVPLNVAGLPVIPVATSVGGGRFALSTVQPSVVPPSSSPPAAAVPPADVWAVCDLCQKWRRLPVGTDADLLPEQWYCHMNAGENGSIAAALSVPSSS